MTDMWILEVVLEKHGIPLEASRAKMDELKDSMVEYCKAHADGIAVRALPGVPELLAALSARSDVAVCGLVTGNLETIGRMKLAASGLVGPFTFGGFGSDHKDRGELIKLAVQVGWSAVRRHLTLRARVGATRDGRANGFCGFSGGLMSSPALRARSERRQCIRASTRQPAPSPTSATRPLTCAPRALPARSAWASRPAASLRRS